MEERKTKLTNKQIKEKEITSAHGGIMLIVLIAAMLISVAGIIFGAVLLEQGNSALGATVLVVGIVAAVIIFILFFGLHIINPNESMVFTLFGNYYGTIKKPGFYYINPFCDVVNNPAGKAVSDASISTGTSVENVHVNVSSRGKKISTKVLTLNNDKQKVNDMMGNPIVIGAVVIWKVENPTAAVLCVDNYKEYLSIQCDSTIRNIARQYSYDITEDEEDNIEEKTLRGSSLEIAARMTTELQARVEEAGLDVIEVRITHLSYAEEIAAAMLQKQQAVAVIAARKKIVEGAVSMVKMAIDELSEEEIVILDEERKASMVSNLLVVLCGNKDAQPIVNSGSIY